jgi:hypothetical protein
VYGDLYRDIVYHGGMVIGTFGLIWSGGTTAYYTEPPTDMPGGDAIFFGSGNDSYIALPVVPN